MFGAAGIPVSSGPVGCQFEEFASHNAPYEAADYYGKDRSRTVTAREAGQYREQDDIYFDLEEDPGRFMELCPDATSTLYQRFKAEAPGCTYISWLEQQVLVTEPECR